MHIPNNICIFTESVSTCNALVKRFASRGLSWINVVEYEFLSSTSFMGTF